MTEADIESFTHGFRMEILNRYHSELERLLTDAITNRLGSGWTHEDVRGCLDAEYSKDGKVSFFLGEDCLLQNYPPPGITISPQDDDE